MKKGDLFYVPSETMMFGKGRITKLTKPAVFINLKEIDSFYETYFDNQKYLIRKRDTFPVQEGVSYDVGPK